MTAITKEVLIRLRTSVEAALVPVGKKFGVDIEGGNGTYAGDTGSLKLNFKVAGKNIEAERWKEYAQMYGLNKSWIGKTFTDKGATYTIVGLRSGRSRYVVATTKPDGTPYFWTTSFVSEVMGKK